MKAEDRKLSDSTAFMAPATCQHDPQPCIEYLQRTVVHLLLKNQTLRFELLATRHRIDCIKQTLFGTESGDLQKLLPCGLLSALRELCRNESLDSD